MSDYPQLAQSSPPPRPMGTPQAPASPTGPTTGPTTGTTTGTGQNWPGVFQAKADVSDNELIIGGVLVLVFGAVFWFAKRSLARYLIERRASPEQAGRTALMLWMMLMSLALSAVAGFISRKVLFTQTFTWSKLLESTWTLVMSGFFSLFCVFFILFFVFLASARPRASL